jgi:glycosyltransferase involved in cell wall biosynthesis
MRVLHIIPSIGPLRGGPSQAVLEMARHQRFQGIDARILTTNDNGPTVRGDLPIGRWHPVDDVPALVFRRWSPPIQIVREYALSLSLAGWLHRNGKRYDLLHVHSLFSWVPSSAMATARWRGVPYILRPLGLLNRWSLQQSPRRKKLMLWLIDQANICGAASLHCTSREEADEIGDLGLNLRTLVLPLGVSLLPPTHAPAPGCIRFLFLSRLHPKKQLPLLLESLAALQAQRPTAQWELLVAGTGTQSYTKHLKSIASTLGISKRVQWLGFVGGKDKERLLGEVHWFVLPSASENFGIAAAEALAAGTPVVLTPGVALAADVAAYGAGWVCEAELEPLTRRLEDCLDPPSEAMRIAARSLAADHYSWKGITSMQINFYEQVVHQWRLDRHR